MEVLPQYLASGQEMPRQQWPQLQAGVTYHKSNRPFVNFKVEMASLSGERDQWRARSRAVHRAQTRPLSGNGAFDTWGRS